MRCLNEPIAKQANEQDDCSGRFWDGRYKSQALLDEAAVLACMAYVDLNPIRAGLADTPETSEFTSLFARIAQLKAVVASTDTGETAGPVLSLPPKGLLSFAGNDRPLSESVLPYDFLDYLALVDGTGRAIRQAGCDSRISGAHPGAAQYRDGPMAGDGMPIRRPLSAGAGSSRAGAGLYQGPGAEVVAGDPPLSAVLSGQPGVTIPSRIQLASATGGFIPKNT